jgi:predicted PurR-regulated permease PerM
MTPTTRTTLIRLGAGFGFLFVLVWLMIALSSVTAMLMAGFFLAYIFDPVVRRLESLGLPRSIAGGGIVIGALALLVGLILVLIPAIVAEIANFVKEAPQYITQLRDLAFQTLARFQIQIPQDWDTITPALIEKARQVIPELADPAARIISSLFKSTLHLLGVVLQILLVPIIAFYLLASFEGIKQGIVDLIPSYMREPVLQKLREIDTVLSAFVRGQLTIACLLAALYSLGFLVIGIDLALVLGITSGLLWIIPYLGTMVALIAGSTMALIKYGDLVHVGYVVAWIGTVQVLEGYVLTPRIVGKAIGLHPVVYILAVIVGANLFGFVGMLVAIPVTAVLRVLLLTGVEAYRSSELYADAGEESDGAA